MKTGIGCLTIVLLSVALIYLKACKKEIDYLFFTEKFRKDTYFEKFDPLQKGNTISLSIRQNYDCEHAFAIVYFEHRDLDRFTMGNVGKFHFILSNAGNVIEEKTVTLNPVKATPGCIVQPEYRRHELYLFTFKLRKDEVDNARLTVTVLEPMANLEKYRGEIYASILPVWNL